MADGLFALYIFARMGTDKQGLSIDWFECMFASYRHDSNRLQYSLSFSKIIKGKSPLPSFLLKLMLPPLPQKKAQIKDCTTLLIIL